jgi:hypothetical protein
MKPDDRDPQASEIGDWSERTRSIVGWCSVYLLLVGAVHFYLVPFVEGDVPYHIAVGQLIRKHGILYDFPWTPFSWLADHYVDDRLLFHLLFVPLASLDWITAARIVGTLAGTAILMALYLILRAERIRFAGIWALMPLAGSVLFISRFLLIRPHLLSVALAMLFLWAATRSRLVILAAVSVLYPLSYVAFWQLPFLLLIALATARLVAGQPLCWKPAAVAAAGIAAGVAIHPNSANLLRYSWIVMYDVLFQNTWVAGAGFEMGAELGRYPLGGWVQGLSIPVLMTVGAAVYGWRHRRQDMASLPFALAALGFCVLTIRSSRFAEYFVPFSVCAFAFASRHIGWRALGPTIVAASFSFTMLVGYNTFSSWAKETNPMPADVAAFLQEQIPPGSRVFTGNWYYTGILLLTLPDRYFLVALDPTLFHLKDPELYALWFRITNEPEPGIARTIRERFGSRFVIVYDPPTRKRFNFQLSSEPGVRMLLNTEDWMVFDLGLPATSGAEEES